jgi:hypothetical protein
MAMFYNRTTGVADLYDKYAVYARALVHATLTPCEACSILYEAGGSDAVRTLLSRCHASLHRITVPQLVGRSREGTHMP